MHMKRLEALLHRIDYIDFALLFGSYANGTHTTLSDVDIGIHTKRSIDLLDQGHLIGTLEEALQKPVDLVILNDLYKQNAKLAFNIVDNHKIILLGNKKCYDDFKTYTYKYYFDQQEMYSMFDESLKRRIADGTYGKTQAS